MSTVVFFALLPVLLFALIGAGLLKRRGAAGKAPRVEGTVTTARLGENDAGSVTQFYPVLDVSYTVAGRSWTAANLPVARETHGDRARVEALLAGPLSPGSTIPLECDPADPGRVRIATR